MPIKLFQIEPRAPKVVSADVDFLGLDKPDPLFADIDNEELEETSSTVEASDVDFESFSTTAGIPVVPQGGGGGTGGVPVGELPFVAEDYGAAGNPDSNLAPTTEELIDPPAPVVVEELSDPVMVVPETPEQLDDPEPPNPFLSEEGDPFEGLVYFYLLLNRNPSDEQMHMLAAALGVPKERLEECVYRMLRTLLVDEGNKPEVVASADDELDDVDFSKLESTTTEVTDDQPIHSPIINPSNDDEMVENDGELVDPEVTDDPVGFSDGQPPETLDDEI